MPPFNITIISNKCTYSGLHSLNRTLKYFLLNMIKSTNNGKFNHSLVFIFKKIKMKSMVPCDVHHYIIWLHCSLYTEIALSKAFTHLWNRLLQDPLPWQGRRRQGLVCPHQSPDRWTSEPNTLWRHFLQCPCWIAAGKRRFILLHYQAKRDG